VTSWRFRGVSRFDSIISGGLAKGEVTVNANEMWHSPDALACIGIDETYRGPHPISGGSDAPIDVVSNGRGLSGPPISIIKKLGGDDPLEDLGDLAVGLVV